MSRATADAGAMPSRASRRSLMPAIFAAQFGTQEARDHLLEGLNGAGFH
jgi:hypothetical protein